MISDQELETKVDKLFDKLTPDLSGQILKDIDAADKPAVRKRNRKNLCTKTLDIITLGIPEKTALIDGKIISLSAGV